MSDSYDFGAVEGDLPDVLDKSRTSTNALGVSATSFANAISKAFAQATTGGKQFDDVLKQLALKLSSLAVTQAAKPVAKSISSSLSTLLGGSSDGGGEQTLAARLGAIKPFASGGVIGTPTYFPLSSGGLGLAGEAGPEAIMPLTRGADGRLGVAMNGGGTSAINVQIAASDAGSFKRSEAYITGQIARAVARGQRGM